MKEMHYFIALEDELANSFNYIEPEQDNLKCYGAKYASLLNSICIEFESLSRILIQTVAPKTVVSNIADIKQHLFRLFPKIGDVEVTICRTRETKTPFKDWTTGQKFKWWDAYSKLKHSRIKNYKAANLDNVFEAMCALLVIIIYLSGYRDDNSGIRCGDMFWVNTMNPTLIGPSGEVPDKM